MRYVLEGSVRKAGNRVRIAGQLIDASNGSNLWGERFEGMLDDVFELQDQVTASVVGAIAHWLEVAEIDRAARKPTESLDAYDFFLRGMARFHKRSEEGFSEALRLFQKAFELDPNFASAYAMAAWCYTARKVNRWMGDERQEIAEGIRLASRALDLGKDDAVALTRGGHAMAHLSGDIEAGIGYLDRALVLNPNFATAWILGAYLRLFVGKLDEAIEYFERAARLSPLDPEMFRIYSGFALTHLLARRFDLASEYAEKSIREWPNFIGAFGIVAASNALAGRMDQARQAMQQLREVDPDLRLSKLPGWLPIRKPELLAIWAEGLRKAGLPE